MAIRAPDGAKKALENWESARGRYMCANFVGDKCVFQHSMTDSVQKCRTNSPLCTFFSAQTFFTGAASLLGMLVAEVVLLLLFLLLLLVVVVVELQQGQDHRSSVSDHHSLLHIYHCH